MSDLPVIIPPYNIKAESVVINQILSTPQLLDKVLDKIYPDDFFNNELRRIYSAIVTLNENGVAIDSLIVSDYLHARDGSINWESVISKCSEHIDSFSNFMHYVQIIIEKSLARSSYKSALDLVNKINTGVNIRAILSGWIDSYYTLSPRAEINSVSVEAKDGIMDILDEVTTAMHKGEFVGLSTGFTSLDRGIGGGFERGKVTIIAARPAGGKTALATSIAIKLSESNNISLLFSLEMSKKDIQYRLVSYYGEIAIADLKTGNMNQYKYERFVSGCDKASNLNIIIDQSSSLTIETIIARSHGYKSKYGCNIMFVDYLQLLHSEHKYEKRVNELEYITARFKQLAKELDIPIVLLSQLNRSAKMRDDKTPVVEDMRGSGSIEQDADIVLLLEKMDTQRSTVDIIVGKNRDGGASGTIIPMHFKSFCGKFEDNIRGEYNDTQSRSEIGQRLWEDGRDDIN